MAIANTTNVGVGKELSKDCSLPVPTVGYTNSDEGGLPFRMTRKSIPTTLLLLIEVHGLLLFLHLGVKVLAVLRHVWKSFQGLFYGIGEQVLTGSVDEGRFVGLFHDVDSKKMGNTMPEGMMSPLRVMKKGVPTACTSAVGKPVTYDGGFLSLSPKSQHKPHLRSAIYPANQK